MLLFVAAWLGGGVAYMCGSRWLLYVKHAKFDHVERMAKIAVERARVDEEIERSRAERAGRTRPDLAEALAVFDAVTEVFPPVPVDEVGDQEATDMAGDGMAAVEVPADLGDEWADDMAGVEPECLPACEDVLAEPERDGWPSAQDNDDADSGKHRLPSTL